MTPVQIYNISVVIYFIRGVISTINFVLGLVSWIVIPKWRNFKNYVLMNVIFAFSLFFVFAIVSKFTGYVALHHHTRNHVIVDICNNFFCLATYCWLIVLTMVFYTDIDEQFHIYVTRKKLKCSIFGWGLPVLMTVVRLVLLQTTGLSIYIMSYQKETGDDIVFTLLLLINVLVYLQVLCFLSGATQKWQKILKASLAFAMSESLLMVSVLTNDLELTTRLSKTAIVLNLLTVVAVNVYFVVMKEHRELWQEFYKHRMPREEQSSESCDVHL